MRAQADDRAPEAEVGAQRARRVQVPEGGGVRIEDVALVTKSGSRNLTRVPKVLEI